jgi:hypothetical protein
VQHPVVLYVGRHQLLLQAPAGSRTLHAKPLFEVGLHLPPWDLLAGQG